MKVTGIISSLAIASVASAAAIPREIGITSTLNAAITKLDSVLGTVEGTANNAVSCLTGPVDLSDIQSQLADIQGMLGGILPALPGLPIKRANLAGPLNTVNGVITGAETGVSGAVGAVEGTVSPLVTPVTTVAESVAGPVVGTVEGVAGSTGVLPRSLDVSSLVPLAQQVVTDVTGEVVATTIIEHVNQLAHQASVILSIPLSLPVVGELGNIKNLSVN